MSRPAAPARPELTVVIPALDEAEALPATLRELVRVCEPRGWAIIVVDDGSVDETADLARQAGVELVRHKVPRGYGAALKSGIRAARGPWVATFDADGQHDPEELPQLLAAAKRADADMLVGDRGKRASSRYRSIGKAMIRGVTRILMPHSLHDVNSGLKLYRTRLAGRYADLCPDSMAFSEVVTLIFLHRRHRVIEQPITIRPRQGGRSTITTRTAVDALVEVLNIVTLLGPLRIFLPIAAFAVLAGLAWGLPIVLAGRGVSVGSMLAIVTGVILFALGLLAEQLSAIRRRQVEEPWDS